MTTTRRRRNDEPGRCRPAPATRGRQAPCGGPAPGHRERCGLCPHPHPSCFCRGLKFALRISVHFAGRYRAPTVCQAARCAGEIPAVTEAESAPRPGGDILAARRTSPQQQGGAERWAGSERGQGENRLLLGRLRKRARRAALATGGTFVPPESTCGGPAPRPEGLRKWGPL